MCTVVKEDKFYEFPMAWQRRACKLYLVFSAVMVIPMFMCVCMRGTELALDVIGIPWELLLL